MTKREAAIVSAYTGTLIGEFGDMHEYVEELIGRPVWTHEFPDLFDKIKELSQWDFVNIKIASDENLPKWYKPEEILPDKSGTYICIVKDDWDGYVYQDKIMYVKDNQETKDGWYESYIPEYGYLSLRSDEKVLCWLQMPELPEGVVLS